MNTWVTIRQVGIVAAILSGYGCGDHAAELARVSHLEERMSEYAASVREREGEVVIVRDMSQAIAMTITCAGYRRTPIKLSLDAQYFDDGDPIAVAIIPRVEDDGLFGPTANNSPSLNTLVAAGPTVKVAWQRFGDVIELDTADSNAQVVMELPFDPAKSVTSSVMVGRQIGTTFEVLTAEATENLQKFTIEQPGLFGSYAATRYTHINSREEEFGLDSRCTRLD